MSAWFLALASLAAGALLLGWSQVAGVPAFYPWGALYGAANGIMTIVRGLAVPEMLTQRAYGAVNGALAAPASISRALAPLGTGVLWSTTGSYDVVLMALIVGSLVMAVGFWLAAHLSYRAVPSSQQ